MLKIKLQMHAYGGDNVLVQLRLQDNLHTTHRLVKKEQMCKGSYRFYK